jgi:hypothetical protein
MLRVVLVIALLALPAVAQAASPPVITTRVGLEAGWIDAAIVGGSLGVAVELGHLRLGLHGATGQLRQSPDLDGYGAAGVDVGVAGCERGAWVCGRLNLGIDYLRLDATLAGVDPHEVDGIAFTGSAAATLWPLPGLGVDFEIGPRIFHRDDYGGWFAGIAASVALIARF